MNNLPPGCSPLDPAFDDRPAECQDCGSTTKRCACWKVDREDWKEEEL
jgi:hypothetical protein